MRTELEQIINSKLPLVLEYDEIYDKVKKRDIEEH